MQSKPFREQNLLLGAGNNPNTEDMPVCVCHNDKMTEGQSIPFLFSFWSMNEEELIEAKKNGGIYIATMGFSPPPIVAVAHNPFKYHDYTPYERGKGPLKNS